MMHSFELKRICVYVGETKDLQRRLREHLPETEQNPTLRGYIRRNYTCAICWYASVDGVWAKTVQDDLIQKLQPRCNVQGR